MQTPYCDRSVDEILSINGSEEIDQSASRSASIGFWIIHVDAYWEELDFYRHYGEKIMCFAVIFFTVN